MECLEEKIYNIQLECERMLTLEKSDKKFYNDIILLCKASEKHKLIIRDLQKQLSESKSISLKCKEMTLDNKIHFNYVDFSGHIESVNILDKTDNEYKLRYKVSITKNGVDFSEVYYPTLEYAFRFLAEYNEQLKSEKEQTK